MNLNRRDFTLSFSSCRLCTKLYLSSHHTSAWEWLAFPQGHLIRSPCFIYTNTHAFIILLLYFAPRLALHSALAVRTRQKVLQHDCMTPEQCKLQSWAMQTPVMSKEVTQPPVTRASPWAFSWAICMLLNRDIVAQLGKSLPNSGH